MPTNANTFNSRVTSEALEKKFRDVFPAQGGAELVQDLFASGVIQPVIDFSSVAEGSILPSNLQTAWDIATGLTNVSNGSSTLISNPGFWKVDLNVGCALSSSIASSANVTIDDGATSQNIWRFRVPPAINNEGIVVESNSFVVFLKAGEELKADTTTSNTYLTIWYRQIADVSGNLVNPTGFSFS